MKPSDPLTPSIFHNLSVLVLMCAALLFTTHFAWSQSATPSLSVRVSQSEQDKIKRLEAWLTEQDKAGNISGSLLYARNGEVLLNRSFGKVHPQQGKAITAESSINIGSVSKSFAALAIMLLKADGQLDYDDKVQKHLAQFPYPTITIRHLLTHTSGLVDYEVLTDEYWHEHKLTNRDMVDLYIKHKPGLEFAPGEQFEYSNTGYVVLAALVEHISKSRLEAFSQQRIFTPLGMNHTRVFTVYSKPQAFANRVYGQEHEQLLDQYHIEGVTGDGGIYSTPEDLYKWYQGMQSETLLSRQAMNEAFVPATLNDGTKVNYGFGWIVSDQFPGMFTHDGAWLGFRAFLSANSNNHDFLVFITNKLGGVSFTELRNQLLTSIDAPLTYRKGNFQLCTKYPKDQDC